MSETIDLNQRLQGVRELNEALITKYDLTESAAIEGQAAISTRNDIFALMKELDFAWQVIRDILAQGQAMNAELQQLKAKSKIEVAPASALKTLAKVKR